eukprot:CAMPEP_0184306222 /NCGR_PEP_ID=MMETSP1049-20130417/15279_1 /TAXON_ID=77928 /ORGANISM="Proteomonas sulcata, Strain CCMP704" /LENGTH=139 /DNA_ID=CAMNT_0026618439 /DNA_START=157 /DNA_END=576 /DNA_ORIENTATION=+
MTKLALMMLLLAPATVLAFVPALGSIPTRQCPGALRIRSCRNSFGLGLRMQEEGEKKDGPIYEDDIDAGVMKSKTKTNSGGVSDSMKARLLKESQALGGDPNVTPVNWAVVIATVIAGLAVVGSVFGAFGGRSDPSSPF